MVTTPEIYAHSLPGHLIADWETLQQHLHAVENTAARFGASFGWSEAARVMGRLHDIGKASTEFQAYIRRAAETDDGEVRGRGGDHSTAGARVARDAYGKFGTLFAYGIAGHHAGLGDWTGALERRLDPAQPIPGYGGWEHHAEPLPNLASLLSSAWEKGPYKGFSAAFLARMLFSCLVDADSIETARFYVEPAPPAFTPLPALLDILRSWQAGRAAPQSDVDALQAEVLDHAVAQAALTPACSPSPCPRAAARR